MIEATGNLWTYPADCRVITTNGTVKRNGECVMGRGCAAEAAKMFPCLPKMLGTDIRARGNIPHNYMFSWYPNQLWTFPVKHNWYETADLQLIESSVRYFAEYLAHSEEDSIFVMPRPGCGNGKLSWTNVRPILEVLPDNVVVITW